MPTGQRAPADPTQGEVAAGRCATCGSVILAGDDAWEGEGEELYCDSECAARAHCKSVTVDGERRIYHSDYTLYEARRLVQDYWALLRRVKDLREMYLGMARYYRWRDMVSDALWYEQVARDISRLVLLEKESPASGQGAAGDQSRCGAESGHSAPPF